MYAILGWYIIVFCLERKVTIKDFTEPMVSFSYFQSVNSSKFTAASKMANIALSRHFWNKAI